MWILIAGILIDQISKNLVCNVNNTISIIPNILSIEYVENYGAVFGIMQGSNRILAVVSCIICLIITIYIIKAKNKKEKVPFAWYMILAGGIGNLIDRIIRGYVVDFIATPFIATFNIADSLVVVGVCLLIINEIITINDNKKKEE